MQYRMMLAIVSLSLSAMACSGKRESSSNPPISSTDASAPASASNAHWSAMIDGMPVTGNGVDEMQQQNAAYNLPLDGSRPRHLTFYLFSTKNGADQSANYSMRYWLPPAPGSHAKHGSTDHSCDSAIRVNVNIAPGGVLGIYDADTATVTIASVTVTRVSGTFSGTFALGADTPRAPEKRVTITNGTFDIPMSTSKMTPE